MVISQSVCTKRLLPDVLQVAAHKCKVVLTKHFHTVPDNPPGSLTMLHKIEFIDIVLVQGIIEAGLVSFLNVVTVTLPDRGYLNNQISHILDT